MKVCPQCNNQIDDDAAFCTRCGATIAQASQPQQQSQYVNNQQTAQQPYVQPVMVKDPADHTDEFDKEEVSKNKIFAMLGYIFGFYGIIVALLANKSAESEYLRFHVKEALKILILDAIISVLAVFLFWTILVPLACSVFATILTVIKVICFIKVCSNKSIEAPIVRSFNFLK